MTVNYAEWLLRWRWLIIACTLAVVGLSATGLRYADFDTDYRVFFSEDNPQLLAFDALQNIYSKNDNILIVIAPDSGAVFTPEVLDVVERLTHDAWQIPYSSRVDSVTNFQHTYAEEDDLVVEDLVEDALQRTPEELAAKKAVALAEPLLLNRLISPSAHVTGVNVTIELPGESTSEVEDAVTYARQLAAAIRAQHPGIAIYMTGMTAMNNAFPETSKHDSKHLLPIMLGMVVLVMLLSLRSISGTVVTVMVIIMSALTAVGLAFWSGIKLTPPSASAPIIIMTLAVADSIHILISMFREMAKGKPKNEALVESMRINMQPVFLTSLTTVIGFLALNFSDAPPFRDFGNITAVGVIAAFFYSVTFLPAVISLLPVKERPESSRMHRAMDALAEFVIRRRFGLFWGMLALIVGLSAFVPRIELNDEFVKYFDDSISFRTDTDFVMDNLTGIYIIEHSLGAGESGGINDPAYLRKVEEFARWYRSQPQVMHVSTLTDIMKRLNQNMHADDPGWYRLPDSRELAAQYLLLYEMSLPFGLDLNNQINIDKSAIRFTVTMQNMSAVDVRSMKARAEQWLQDNAPEYMFSRGASPTVMFSYISERNIKSMIKGTAIAVVLIAITLMLMLRSVKIGLLSLIPNVTPALMTFGLWSLLVGRIGLAVSIIMAMSLGIVVDDTVHFLSKYLRARREQGLGSADAVRYAFSTVGIALVVTSIILITGFLILATSAFQVNWGMGLLTAIAIAFALLADFLFLPPLLMKLEEEVREDEDTAAVTDPAPS